MSQSAERQAMHDALVERNYAEGIEALKQFVSRNGEVPIPDDAKELGFDLGYWARGQRASYRLGTISIDKAKEIQAVPGWIW